MDRVSAEFHKNLLILTKYVPPHDDFKKHFKEGMFDKPNTLGFIHVSFYLFSVYYKDHVKNKIQWPVICKQTEYKFRNDVKECLMIMANENSDLNFPPILASHLLLAKGTKFILIMWKFSLVVLRTYLTREYKSVVPIAPKQGPCQELTKTFLKTATKVNNEAISSIRKHRQCTEEEAKDFLRKKIQEQTELKGKILKLRKDLKEIIATAPVNNSARKKLISVEDNEIIEMWTGFIDTMLENTIKNVYETLKELDEFLKFIGNTVLNLAGNTQTLNAHKLDRVNIEPIYKLVPQEMQVLPYNLYNRDNLNLQNFFCIFNLLIQNYETSFQKNDLAELANCIVQLQMSNKDFKTAINHFQNLHEQITSFTSAEIKKLEELNNSQRNVSSISELDKVLFMPSPSIQINNYAEGSRNIYQNHLKLTPVEGAHKELFSRHAFTNERGLYSAKKKLHAVQRINFDDSMMYNIISDKECASQPRIYTPQKLKSTFKNVDKYSRIFSTRKPNDHGVNNSVMMMMSSTGNSMLPLLTKQHCISLMDSCNLSQEFSQEPLLLNPNLNSTIETSKVEEVEKAPQKNPSRRSIGDLVERYKKLIQKRDSNSQALSSPVKQTLGEETDINCS